MSNVAYVVPLSTPTNTPPRPPSDHMRPRSAALPVLCHVVAASGVGLQLDASCRMHCASLPNDVKLVRNVRFGHFVSVRSIPTLCTENHFGGLHVQGRFRGNGRPTHRPLPDALTTCGPAVVDQPTIVRIHVSFSPLVSRITVFAASTTIFSSNNRFQFHVSCAVGVR